MSAVRKFTVGGIPVQERFVRSAGPRGQNLDRDATAVELRIQLDGCSLPAEARSRLLAQNRKHITKRGTLVLVARASRSQLENRRAARARLVAMLDSALLPAAERRERTPMVAEQETRLRAKHRTSGVKRTRSSHVTLEDES